MIRYKKNVFGCTPNGVGGKERSRAVNRDNLLEQSSSSVDRPGDILPSLSSVTVKNVNKSELATFTSNGHTARAFDESQLSVGTARHTVRCNSNVDCQLV